MNKVSRGIAGAIIAMVLLLCLSIGAMAEGNVAEEYDVPVEVSVIEEPVVEEAVEVPAAQPEAARAEPEVEIIAEIPVYTVKFLSWDDAQIGGYTLEEGAMIQAPQAQPVREGYVFAFWYDASGAASAYNFAQGIQRDTILKAFFTEIPAAEEAAGETDQTEAGAEVTGAESADVTENTAKTEEDIWAQLNIIIIADGDDVKAAAEETEVEAGEADEGEIIEIEDEEIPLAGPAVAVERQVNVYSNMGTCINEGDTVTLTGELIGFDGCNVMIQWQYDNGNGWMDVEGANSLSYSFSATSESVSSSWRMAVTIID